MKSLIALLIVICSFNVFALDNLSCKVVQFDRNNIFVEIYFNHESDETNTSNIEPYFCNKLVESYKQGILDCKNILDLNNSGFVEKIIEDYCH